MIDFLRTWANQIIVAVIIATIFEMILPDGNNKKYIKMIIGVYVLFTIIQPIITKVTANTLDISNFNYEKYFDEEPLETSMQDFENNNSKLIKQTYIDNIKNDIINKINKNGYEVLNLSVDIVDDEKKDTYGIIENINLKIKKEEIDEATKEENTNTIEVENIDINISSNINNVINNTEAKSNISDKEKRKIIEYLADEYKIAKENIIIN